MLQENLFKVAGLPMVDNCMGGYNSCMFAYGQVSHYFASLVLVIKVRKKMFHIVPSNMSR